MINERTRESVIYERFECAQIRNDEREKKRYFGGRKRGGGGDSAGENRSLRAFERNPT